MSEQLVNASVAAAAALTSAAACTLARNALETHACVQEVAVQQDLVWPLYAVARRDRVRHTEGAAQKSAHTAHLVGFFELVAHFVEGERPPNAFQATMPHRRMGKAGGGELLSSLAVRARGNLP